MEYYCKKKKKLIQTILAVLVLGTVSLRVVECKLYSSVLDTLHYRLVMKTLNTKAFKAAIDSLSKYASQGCVILASQDEAKWPLVPALPSYGRRRDGNGDGRFSSLIFGTNLTDIIIILSFWPDHGQYWWDKFHQGQSNVTRPYMIEIQYSNKTQISNLTLINSPSWFVHPTYSSDVLIHGLTILALIDSPNTDEIDPGLFATFESLALLAIPLHESGWDQYGIKFGMPTKHLIIRRLTCISPDSATIALGSEMSGGIQDVRAEDITTINTQSGIRIKTAIGRGAYVKDIFVRRMTLTTMKWVFLMSGFYNQHLDTNFDPKAISEIKVINYRDIVATNVTGGARLEGIAQDHFTGICISNVTISLSKMPKELQWNCTNIAGVMSNVTLEPCHLLPKKEKVDCAFPKDRLPIEDVHLKTCSTTETA
ncbi:hypothetical protein I3842_05G255600 [Carya illinoinensis]|uniref:Polygalacturonase n=1 Tax=Carya illinoinensis TaxID=32201 RepID=A0A922F758_CARIL|nr:hypothetical protein I3842_05G255600 [Carya illinoinensis]